MEVFAAMIDRMDQGIGRLVDALEAKGQLDNTLILYLQDNGGCAESNGRKPRKQETKPAKAMRPDELQKSMDPAHTRDGLPVLTGPAVMPGPATSYIAYGRNWANVSNTPFRYYKSNSFEGGIATPLIVHWPKGIKARNELRHQTGHLIDIMPTCVEVSGASYPATFNGNVILPMEGRSLVPGFATDHDPERVLIWEHFGNAAIRVGKWKLVRLNDKPLGDGTDGWELYDLAEDRSEMKNLAADQPGKVRELAALWQTHARRTLIFPKPVPRGK